MAAESTSGGAAATQRHGYAWYVAGALMVAYMFSFLDRQILNLMIGPIRRDLAISDLQFGFLSGAAFGLFFSVAALPLGWLADRYSRKWIIATGMLVWSGMTLCCGLASGFGQLFAARVGVGVGEATLSPSTYSLLADYFEKKRLPRAMSIYSIGVFMGAGLALIIGGEVVGAIERLGPIALPVIGVRPAWQLVFMIVALPGVLVALVLAATIREPARRGSTAERAPLGEVFRFIGENRRVCVALLIGGALYTLMGSVDAWYPELFIRTWGWDAAHAGRVNGASSLIAGPLGLIFAGWYSSYLMAHGRPDACLRVTSYGALGLGLSAAIMPLMPTPTAMALCLVPFKFFIGFPLVLVTSGLQMIAPNQFRAQLGAMFLFLLGVLAVAVGPVLPALLTQYLFHDDSKLRYSLALSACFSAPIVYIFLRSGLAGFRSRVMATA
jgi:MFS family permease